MVGSSYSGVAGDGIEGGRGVPGIFWIGGSTFSGKSTVSGILARGYGMEVLSCDDELPRHVGEATLDHQPTMHLFSRMMDLPLLLLPGHLLAESLRAMALEQLEMILDELAKGDTPDPLLVEGSAVLPEALAPHLTQGRQAVWLVSNEDFLLDNYRAARESLVAGTLARYDDPERAFRGWMDRDLAFSALVRRQVKELGLTALEVDGTRSAEEIAAEVARLFGLERDGGPTV